MKTDFHIHTLYSRDGSMSLETVIETARRRHIDCLAITDHNTTYGAEKMIEHLPPNVPLKIIVGEEIKTTHGEIIGLFIREEIPPDLSPEETVAQIKAQGGLVYIPHPFDRLRRSRLEESKLLELLPQIDIIEVYNARITVQADNLRAEELARNSNLLRAAGSDAHCTYELGRAYVEMPPFETKEEFLLSLARGKVVGRLSSPLVHFVSTWSKLRKKHLG